MTTQQIETAAAWLALNQGAITRIRPRLAGSIIRYIPRQGWGPGLEGHMPDAPAMWASLDAPDPLDGIFRALNIPVDQPL